MTERKKRIIDKKERENMKYKQINKKIKEKDISKYKHRHTGSKLCLKKWSVWDRTIKVESQATRPLEHYGLSIYF